MLGLQGADATDAVGKERKNWGYLAQTTYMLTPELKVGVNYGQSNAIATANDTGNNIRTQQAAVGALTYNVMKHIQLIGEYTWAQDRWHNGLHQNSNMVALGTFFYW